MALWVKINGSTWLNLDNACYVDEVEIGGEKCLTLCAGKDRVMRLSAEDSEKVLQTIIKSAISGE